MTFSGHLRGLLHLAWGAIRQSRYPPEFRIPEPEAGKSLLEEADRLMGALVAQGTPVTTEDGSVDRQRQFLARTATGLWRLRQRMVDPASGEPREEMKRAYRHFESVWDALIDFGVEVRGHTGERFNSGMALRVLSYEPDPSLTQELVKETVKPTIFLHDRCIQRGEVIVGTPEA